MKLKRYSEELIKTLKTEKKILFEYFYHLNKQLISDLIDCLVP